jgi:hypothetical protein
MANKRIIIATLTFGSVLLLSLVALRSRKSLPLTAQSNPELLATYDLKSASVVPDAEPSRGNFSRPTTSIHSATNESATTLAASRTPQLLLAEILEISSTEGPITAEKAERFKRNLE